VCGGVTDSRIADCTFFGDIKHIHRVTSTNQDDPAQRGIEILVNNGVMCSEH